MNLGRTDFSGTTGGGLGAKVGREAPTLPGLEKEKGRGEGTGGSAIRHDPGDPVIKTAGAVRPQGLAGKSQIRSVLRVPLVASHISDKSLPGDSGSAPHATVRPPQPPRHDNDLYASE